MSDLTDKIAKLERQSGALWEISDRAATLELTDDIVASDIGFSFVIMVLLEELAEWRSQGRKVAEHLTQVSTNAL